MSLVFVFPPGVVVVDDPWRPRGPRPTPLDGEGVADPRPEAGGRSGPRAGGRGVPALDDVRGR